MTPSTSGRFVDLSHDITAGMTTYPGLPAPTIADHLTREAAEQVYGPGITFQIGLVTMCTNTGTYLDVPFHRFADGHDLTGLALERVADVPAVCLDRRRRRRDRPRAMPTSAGLARTCRTGPHRPRPARGGPTPTSPTTRSSPPPRPNALVAADVACVGIDSLNIDSTVGGDRPVHTTLLRAGIPIIEHLTGLDQLPADGFRFTAVPPKIEGAGTFTVRAFATV